MKVFSEREIKELVAHPQMYAKGLRHYHVDSVKELQYDTINRQIKASVEDDTEYNVSVQIRNGDISGFHCTCANFDKYDGACEHVVAVLKQCNEKYNGIKKETSLSELLAVPGESDPASVLINAFRREKLSSGEERQDCRLEVHLQLRRETGIHLKQRLKAELFLKIGLEQLYVLKNFNAFFEARDKKLPLPMGKKFTYNPCLHRIPADYKELVKILHDIYEWDKDSKTIKGKTVQLSEGFLKEVLNTCQHMKFQLTHIDGTVTETAIRQRKLPIQVSIKEEGNRLVLQIDRLKDYYFLTEDGSFIYFDEKIYGLHPEQRVYFKMLYEESYKEMGRMVFTGGQRDAFVSDILPVLKEWARVEVDESIEDKIIEAGLNTKLYLDWNANSLKINLIFDYESHTFNGLTDTVEHKSGQVIVLRDTIAEGRIKALLAPYQQYLDIHGSLFIDEEEVVYDFLFDTLPLLAKSCDIKYSGQFDDRALIYQPTVKTGATLGKRIDYFEYTFSIEGIEPKEFRSVRAQMKNKKRYYRTGNGTVLNLENEDFKDFMFFMEQLKMDPDVMDMGVAELPKYQAFMLNDFLKDHRHLHFSRSHVFKDYVDGLLHPEDMDFELPDSLKDILRDYQNIGYKWLKALSQYGLGGILADDMGLGKTLQVIAYLISEYDKDPRPTLVVVPTSLIYNWKDEIMKFAPDLRVTLVTGDKVTRKSLIESIDNEHIVLSTYALIRNDVDLYKEKNFSCCILDEAQYIKNPNALITKAVKDIQADGYLALTGTPIENSLQELWSIFDFLMPGYLYSYNHFASKYERPITKQHDKKAAGLLAKYINPFIMRRMKQDVLTELPPKIEDIKSCQLTRDQKKLYVNFLEKTKSEIHQAIEENGFERSKLKILTLLTRLRQICCHPGLFVEDYKGDSGKLELLKELVSEAVAGGHRILVFSQFTSMLKIIRSMLDDMSITYQYLDGSVKSADRIERVNAFNNGEGHVFLISLKAGGTGLNLTSADMVIHYDPWWNPAVEDQATDRAYRLGQQKSVQVIRLLTKGTIEEKIFELKEQKRFLVEQVIDPSGGVLGQLTKDELMDLIEDIEF